MLTSKSLTPALFAGAAVTYVATPAFAVDLVNRDKVVREAVVNHSNGDSTVLTLKPGQRLGDICTACVILVGDSSIEASGRAIAVISGGKISVGG
jgi:hypothetical protein